MVVRGCRMSKSKSERSSLRSFPHLTGAIRFVDRYIPGYVFFGDGVVHGGFDEHGQHKAPPWLGNGLCIQVGEHREVVHVSEF